MKKRFFLFIIIVGSGFLTASAQVAERETQVQPKAVKELLNRIGGKGTSERFITLLTPQLSTDETFIISQKDNKPCIEANTLSALTAGLGWYLNHYAHINIAWNSLTTDLSAATLPLPSQPEQHQCNASYRYYFNYCTFGYSMSVWTWQRWQQEIDWMALHGINMPLQIIGLEKVWREFLMNDLGKGRNYTEQQAEAFVPGPAFIAWWGMNNLEGWGGDTDNPLQGVSNNAWYDRQATLAHHIIQREKELGIEPVLPGFSGMVPSNFQQLSGYKTEQANKWCGFQRPTIVDPTSPDFACLAKKYYQRLHQIMGKSNFYSMDPFHEGGTISSGRYAEGYAAIYQAMNANTNAQTKWVIQQWQWAKHQATSLEAVPAGRLLVLDLFSDAQPRFDQYQGYLPQEAIFCIIPNFGGRTGFFGSLPRIAETYFSFKKKYPSIKGIGAAPEAIEQTPVVYDLLFELPWMSQQPHIEAWMQEYVLARYGCNDPHAIKAWQLLLKTALNNNSTLQGPHEAIVCARPSLHVQRVSSWGSTDIFYKDKINDFILANKELLQAQITSPQGRENYIYDLCDITRQSLTDHAQELLAATCQAWNNKDTIAFRQHGQAFLQLILDIDDLLATHPLFRLGRWTTMAREVAQEIKGSTQQTQDWLEYTNARTLITTWGQQIHSEGGGLCDYSYREWQGLLRDYYYPRWHYFFTHNCTSPASWFTFEWQWAHTKTEETYSPHPQGSTIEKSKYYFNKYFPEKTN